MCAIALNCSAGKIIINILRRAVSGGVSALVLSYWIAGAIANIDDNLALHSILIDGIIT
jgi:hypothetical protein